MNKTFSASALPGSNDIFRKRLPNGITFLSRSNPASPALVFRGYIPGGSVLESPSKAGLASFYANMLLAGTQSLDFKDLHEKIESLGASLGIGAGALSLAFSGQCLNEDLGQLLTLLYEIFTQPAFPARQFKRIRAQTLTALDLQNQDTTDMAAQSFERLLYGEHPFAIPALGFPQTVNAFTLDDLQRFHNQALGPQGMVIAVVGGLEPELAFKIFEPIFSGWSQPLQHSIPPLPQVSLPTRTLREHVPLQDKSQTDLFIGTFSPKTMGADYYACSLGDNILGRFGMMGRLGQVVREEAGLAYGIQSNMGTGLGPAPWQIMAGVNPDNLEKVIALIVSELRRFTEYPVTQEELEDSRSQIIGRLPLSLETNAGVALALLSIERYGLSLNHMREIPSQLAQITPAQILEAVQSYWIPDALVITSAGRAL